MATSIDTLANALFGGKRAETQEVTTDATTRTYVGTALTDSVDGTVVVDLGGDVTLPDDIEGVAEYSGTGVTVATGPGVRAGDEVVVTIVGGTTLKTPMVTSVTGEGDNQYYLIGEAADAASAAWDYAGDAATAAETAWDWADDAHDAAQTAWNHADDAATAAQTAWNHADEAAQAAATAQNSATAANSAASSALTQLSIVEDVAGTLNWISEHGTYVATTDTTVHDGTVYFEYTGGDYVPIASPDPTANPQQEGWYVLDVTDSQSDYIMAHLAVTSQGLWVLPSGITYELSQDTEVVTGRAYFTRSGSGTAGDPYAYAPVNPQGSEDPHALGWYVHTERYSAGYKVLLASNGMTVYDGTGTAVAAYGGTGIRFADDRTFYVGDEDAFVFFDGNGHIEIGGAVNLGSTHTLSELLAAYDTAALSVKIISSNGTGFVDETGSTVLTCKVYQYGDQELDPQGTSFSYSWSTGATSKSITVSAPATTATYTCEVTISGVSVTLSESITLTNVNSGQQGPQGPAGADGKTLYATCSTSAGTQTKAAYLSPEASSLTLYAGLTVQVKFSNANSYASGAVKLNLYKTSSAGLGAIDVYYNDAATSSTNTLGWAAGAVLTFTYDGTYWRVADSGTMGAVYREQVIWHRSDSATAPTAPTTWLTTSTDQYNGWSLKVTPAAANRSSGTTYYQYLYTCIQRKTVAQMGTTACTCTAVVLDETTTVVSGSMIVERSLQARHMQAGSLTIGEMDTGDADTIAGMLNSPMDEGSGGNLLKGATWSSSNDLKWITSSTMTGGWYKESSASVTYDSTTDKIVVESTSTSTGTLYGICQNVILQKNTTYTLSAEVGSTFFIGYGLNTSFTSWPADSGDWKTSGNRKWKTFTTGDTYVYCRIYIYGKNDGSTISYVNRVRLEQTSSSFGYCDSVDAGRPHIYFVDCDGFELVDGSTLSVHFDIIHTGIYFELDVNDTGAKPVMVNGTTSDAGNQLLFPAGTTLTFVYQSNAFWLMDKPTTLYGYCSTTESAQNKLVTGVGSLPIMSGTVLNMYCGTSSTYTSDWIHVLVGENASAAIDRAVYGSSRLTWSSDTTLTFTFTGNIWYFNNRSDASKTATTYITHVDNSGITVHPSSTTNNRVAINGNGMQVYKGNVSVAEYGDTARIGKAAASGDKNVLVDPNGVHLRDYTTDMAKFYYEAGDSLSAPSTNIEASGNSVLLKGSPTSYDGTQSANVRLELAASRSNLNGVSAGIGLVANADPDGNMSNPDDYMSALWIEGGTAYSDGSTSSRKADIEFTLPAAYRVNDHTFGTLGDPEVITSDNSENVSNQTDTTLASISVPPGKWLVQYKAVFAASSNGRRTTILSTSSTASASVGTSDHGESCAPVNGYQTSINHSGEITNSTGALQTWYLRAWQNSGSTLNSCTGYICVTRQH